MQISADIPGCRIGRKIVEQNIYAEKKGKKVAEVGRVFRIQKINAQAQSNDDTKQVNREKTIEYHAKTGTGLVGKPPGGNKYEEGDAQLFWINRLSELVEGWADKMTENNQKHAGSFHPVDEVLMWSRLAVVFI